MTDFYRSHVYLQPDWHHGGNSDHKKIELGLCLFEAYAVFGKKSTEVSCLEDPMKLLP